MAEFSPQSVSGTEIKLVDPGFGRLAHQRRSTQLSQEAREGILADNRVSRFGEHLEDAPVVNWSPRLRATGQQSFGSYGTENGEFDEPTDVAIDSEGHLWVTDSGNNRVQKFSSSGEYLDQFGSPGSEAGQFANPQSLAVDSQDHVWVADTFNGRVQEFDGSGEFIQIVGTEGTEEETIFQSTSIAIGPNDNIYVAEFGRCRVSVFDPEGQFVDSFGAVGSGDGEFFGSPMVEVDSSGDIWVGDLGNQRIEQFGPSGEFIGQFGKRGSGDGEFSFGPPTSIATDGEGGIWVADSENHRIQKWDQPEDDPPSPIQYSFDQAGHLTEVHRAERPGSPEIDESFAYDGNGLRAERTVSGVVKDLAWNTATTLPSLLSDGDAYYLYGPGDRVIGAISTGGTPVYLHQDQLGSTRILSSAAGAVTGAFSYAPYGSVSGRTGSETTPFGFAGEFTDSQSGLQDLRARVYDPETGQFLNRDPLSAATHQPYAYAFNDPLNRTDPSGLGPCILGFIACDEDDDPCGSVSGILAAGIMAPACLVPEESTDTVVNASAGFGDSLLSPIPFVDLPISGPSVRNFLGINNVDQKSPVYQGTNLAGEFYSLGKAAGSVLGRLPEIGREASKRLDERFVHLPDDIIP